MKGPADFAIAPYKALTNLCDLCLPEQFDEILPQRTAATEETFLL